ncbi:Nif3-like dinuclear metal center hexameric protein [Paenibacillus aceris]|uniref:GTP cyclohydrolase 1 type 2 homolog n=1 Tax=Paenibacillus aceris TaxID=869555 RepID=A0ABS4HUD5_9BACL|nr:Nif3-like dinuclear metal center hexameric protein [Paenibacillus aceris]MBP1962234.1 putative NIF3 family GTP cyclohydrolase 1 type 2 [Paenibacillus aceris]NHW37062.1 transcriptional regulator [Paenibacillus aceris]
MAIRVQDILDQLIEPIGRLDVTVDTLKSGDPSAEVKGIATTFMATHHVIQKAIDLGVNLLITHEGTFYHHHDQIELLLNDPIYLAKQKLIEESGIAIFRFHDYWHRYRPDGIMTGLIQALDWSSYVTENRPAASLLTVPAMTVKELAEYVKSKLGISFVRAAGDLNAQCTRIGLLAGYRGGGRMAIPLFQNDDVDVILAGEGPEWETPEYVRDALHQGRKRAFIALGHAESEEPGMKYLAEMLTSKYPDLPVHFIPEKQVFQSI